MKGWIGLPLVRKKKNVAICVLWSLIYWRRNIFASSGYGKVRFIFKELLVIESSSQMHEYELLLNNFTI